MLYLLCFSETENAFARELDMGKDKKNTGRINDCHFSLWSLILARELVISHICSVNIQWINTFYL